MSAVLHAVESAERADWPAPDPILINGSRRTAPALPLQVFRPFWLGWIEAQAEGKCAPPDYIAAGLLATASALVGNARRALPWWSWKEPPTLWTAVVGNPSAGKSPALDAALDPLRRLEAELNADLAERRREYTTQAEMAKAARDAWTAELRKARGGKGQSAPPMPDEAIEPDRPERRRLVATDATIEALGRLLAANPRGLLYFRDELAGWLGSMDKYGGGSGGADRAFWLEAYSGRPFVVDRVKAPDPLYIPSLSVAIAGGIQPDRLASGLFAGDDDGLAARFLYFWPEPTAPRRPRRAVDEGPALAALRRLLDLEMVTGEGGEPRPWLVPFADTAADVLQEFREANARAEQGAAGLFLSWLGKRPGVACRLALVLEHLWWGGERPGGDPPRQVSKAAVLGAVALIDGYLIPMAERTFGDAALSRAERGAVTVARWIAAHRPEVVNARELRRKKLPGLREAEDVRMALMELVEAGWLVPQPHREGGGPGRPKEDFGINPRLWGQGR